MTAQSTEGPEARFRRALSSSRWDDDDARAVLDALEVSGQSGAAFAREHGLNPKRLQRSKRRLRSEAETDAAPSQLFFPVAVTSPPLARPAVEAWKVELEGGIIITVPCAGGAPLLAETLTAIREGW